MAAKWKKALSFVGFSQFKDNAKKAKGTFYMLLNALVLKHIRYYEPTFFIFIYLFFIAIVTKTGTYRQKSHRGNTLIGAYKLRLTITKWQDFFLYIYTSSGKKFVPLIKLLKLVDRMCCEVIL